MTRQKKRKSTGSLMPNIYFLLEVASSILLVYIALQFDITSSIVYIIFIIFSISVIHFLKKRTKVLNRQKMQSSIIF